MRDQKKSIQSQLLVGDTEVTIVDPSPPGSIAGVPPGKTMIQIMSAASDFIALGRVTGVQGRLTAGADFVESVVEVALTQTIKGDNGGRRSVVLPGGELLVGKTRVKAIKGQSAPLKAGEEVLVFAVSLGGELRSNLRSVFRVTAGKLAPLEPSHGPQLDADSGNDVVAVVGKVRAALGVRQ